MIKTIFLANPYAATFIRNPMGCSPSVLELITPFLSTPWLFGAPLEVDTQRMAGFLDRQPPPRSRFGIDGGALLAATHRYLPSLTIES